MFLTKENLLKTSSAAILTAMFVIGTVVPAAVAGTRVAPSITTQPASETVIAGQMASFTVASTGTAPLTYQWYKDGALISRARSATYQDPATATSDSGSTFTVVVFNLAGRVTSSAATLTVSVPVMAPSITSQPVSPTVTAGQTATFTVGATGAGPLSYQWFKNGAPISRAASSTYLDPATSASNNGSQFTVVVSNPGGSVTSTVATLTVNVAVVVPSITSQPTGQTVTAGQTATFNVAATGTGPLSYQWSKNSAQISGATSSTYQTPVTATSDNGSQFTVVLGNSAGSVTSSAATLAVNAAVVSPSIASQPASQSVTVGQTATFTVSAMGTGPLSYQWSKNATLIKGANSSAYQTAVTVASDNGSQFTVVVSNASGSVTSSTATMTVSQAATFLLTESATQLNFGSVAVSNTGTQTVTLTNTGNSNVTISNLAISGAGFNASGVAGLILTPGQTAPVTVTFSPSASGSVTGSVTLTSNASNPPAPISLSGTGTAPHSVLLNWTASTSQVVGYNVYSSNVAGGPYAKLSASPIGMTDYSDQTVQSARTYYYVTTAVDSSNNESTHSQEVSAIIP